MKNIIYILLVFVLVSFIGSPKKDANISNKIDTNLLNEVSQKTTKLNQSTIELFKSLDSEDKSQNELLAYMTKRVDDMEVELHRYIDSHNNNNNTDTQAPSAPTNLTASNITSSSIDLSWSASTDNVSVVGYDVFQDNVFVTTVTTTTFQVNGLSASTSYDFHVIATDASNNKSNASNTINSSTLAPPPVLAFPTAIGAGKNITGGRGGYVVKVTNLNNSGTGSLRAAMLMTGARTIVFDVSGQINITSPIEMILENSNVTIAGQTAPEGGITISGYWLKIGGGYNRAHEPSNNIIIRYIRFRNGAWNGQPDYGPSNGIISSGCDGLVLDHCSFSFCGDQALALGGDYGVFEDVTIQRCTFSDCGTMMIIGTSSQSFATDKITVAQNAFIDHRQRTPNMGSSGQYDVINNYYFNWTGRLSNVNGVNGNSPDINYIGNYMKEGSSTSPGSGNKYQSGTPSIYTANNYHSSLYTTPQLDDRNIWQDFWTGNPVPSSRFTTTMHPLLGNIMVSSALVVPNILSDVGANKFLNASGAASIYQDSYDITKIANANAGISTTPSQGPWTLPTIPNNTRPAGYDTDNDGMPDAYETTLYGDLSKDGTADTDGNGYPDLEDFLNKVYN